MQKNVTSSTEKTWKNVAEVVSKIRKNVAKYPI